MRLVADRVIQHAIALFSDLTLDIRFQGLSCPNYPNRLMLNVSLVDQDSIEDSLFSEPDIAPVRLSSDATIANPWRYVKPPNRRPYHAEPFDHAAPLSPLRDQDLKIMSGWFDQTDMTEVEQDVNRHLALLYPEPPWEESLDLNFLKEHL